MGRHRSPQAPPEQGRLFATIAVLAVVVALGAWALISTAGRGSSTTSAHDHDSTSAAASLPPSESATSPSSSPLTACKAEVTAGKAAAAAANQSYKDWSAHVQAQLDYDAHKITREQTEAIWGATKAKGPQDVAAFDSAFAAYEPLSGSCQQAAKGTTDTAVQQCVTAAKAVADAVADGQKVNADWAAHVKMMAEKAKIGAPYGQMWREMVKEAPANLQPFKTAYDAQAAAPDCGG